MQMRKIDSGCEIELFEFIPSERVLHVQLSGSGVGGH